MIFILGFTKWEHTRNAKEWREKKITNFPYLFCFDSSFISDRSPINFQHHIIYFVHPVYVKKFTAATAGYCVYCFCSFNLSVYIYRWNTIMCCAHENKIDNKRRFRKLFALLFTKLLSVLFHFQATNSVEKNLLFRFFYLSIWKSVSRVSRENGNLVKRRRKNENTKIFQINLPFRPYISGLKI